MIVVLKRNSDKEHVEKLMQHFTDMGLRINYSQGADTLWRMTWSSVYSA